MRINELKGKLNIGDWVLLDGSYYAVEKIDDKEFGCYDGVRLFIVKFFYDSGNPNLCYTNIITNKAMDAALEDSLIEFKKR
jgi:hypothetical protein